MMGREKRVIVGRDNRKVEEMGAIVGGVEC